MGTVNEPDVGGIPNEVTVGGVMSPAGGRVTTTVALRLLETFPAASFAKA